MKLHITKTAPKIIGALRVSEKVFARIKKISEREDSSMQEIVRAILDQVIDEIE